MDVITYQKSYREYKAELDSELQKTAEGFVRIGYLLKVARDTNVLAESGYSRSFSSNIFLPSVSMTSSIQKAKSEFPFRAQSK